jgi:uncharacterized protein with GYD domain
MGFYLMQGNYTVPSVKAMIGTPRDRSEAVAKTFQSAGGKLLHFFFAMGESDWIILCEAPDDVTAAAISMAVSASGGVSNFKTTKLITTAEAMAAMSKAASASYSPPTQAQEAIR